MYEPVTLGPWRRIARCLGSALESEDSSRLTRRQATLDSGRKADGSKEIHDSQG